MGDVSVRDWLEFAQGHWTLDSPTEAGIYLVAARHRTGIAGAFHVRQYVSGELELPSWNGWWWSKPLPCDYGLPPTPDDLEGLEMGEPAIEGWKRFLSGNWTLQQPTEPGAYVIAARHADGVAGTNHVFRYKDGTTEAVRPWNGWWWSEPIPRAYGLPRTGDLGCED